MSDVERFWAAIRKIWAAIEKDEPAAVQLLQDLEALAAVADAL